jgi:hypothetical protein
MERINALRSLIPSQDLTFLSDAQYVYHCHHYNLFHDQTIDDALGEELGTRVRTVASRNAFRELLSALAADLKADTPVERLQMATDVFSWMGQGTLKLSVDEAGGHAEGLFLHYGYCWKEKYGSKVKRGHPADAVAAGFAAAATEVAFDLPPGSMEAHEEQCVALRDPVCRFRIRRADPISAPREVNRSAVEPLLGPVVGGMEEEKISAIADGLRGFLRGVAGDERGLVQAFSVFVAVHMSSYYNETIYEAIHYVEREQPRSAGVAEALFREAGQVCIFNTFGNILLSPEWEGMVGAPSGSPEEILVSCCAIARGLGFGHYALHEYTPEQKVVVRTSSNYEAPFYIQRYGRSDRARCYFIQGATLAFMVLAHRVKWREKPKLTHDFYVSLFRGKIPWKVQQTLCPTRGDALTELVVTEV